MDRYRIAFLEAVTAYTPRPPQGGDIACLLRAADAVAGIHDEIPPDVCAALGLPPRSSYAIASRRLRALALKSRPQMADAGRGPRDRNRLPTS